MRNDMAEGIYYSIIPKVMNILTYQIITN